MSSLHIPESQPRSLQAKQRPSVRRLLSSLKLLKINLLISSVLSNYILATSLKHLTSVCNEGTGVIDGGIEQAFDNATIDLIWKSITICIFGEGQARPEVRV